MAVLSGTFIKINSYIAFVTRKREQRYTENLLSSLSALFLSLTYTLYFPLQHYWHTHSYTPTPRADAYDTVLSHTCCPLTPLIWKTLLWVCETLLRCKDVIGRHGECVWESLFFTRMEKYKIVFVRDILQSGTKLTFGVLTVTTKWSLLKLQRCGQ